MSEIKEITEIEKVVNDFKEIAFKVIDAGDNLGQVLSDFVRDYDMYKILEEYGLTKAYQEAKKVNLLNEDDVERSLCVYIISSNPTYKKYINDFENPCSTESLKARQQKRMKCYEEYKDFIDGMYFEGDKRRGMKYRKWLQHRLKLIAKEVFETEEKEYNAIGKYGRNLFMESSIKTSFRTKKETDILWKIAKEYGAFDY